MANRCSPRSPHWQPIASQSMVSACSRISGWLHPARCTASRDPSGGSASRGNAAARPGIRGTRSPFLVLSTTVRRFRSAAPRWPARPAISCGFDDDNTSGNPVRRARLLGCSADCHLYPLRRNGSRRPFLRLLRRRRGAAGHRPAGPGPSAGVRPGAAGTSAAADGHQHAVPPAAADVSQPVPGRDGCAAARCRRSGPAAAAGSPGHAGRPGRTGAVHALPLAGRRAPRHPEAGVHARGGAGHRVRGGLGVVHRGSGRPLLRHPDVGGLRPAEPGRRWTSSSRWAGPC